MPKLFPLLRALVDQKRTNGRFLILGSASPNLIKNSSESLTGRIVYHEINPFLLTEVGNQDSLIKKLWLRGGYPDSFLAKNNDVSMEWRNNFIKNYLERDVPQLGYRIPSRKLQRFITMIAHYNGQLWNSSQIANSLNLSSPTTSHYLNILEETFIIRRLQPYYFNTKKRLIKSPKIYIQDSGILHSLLSLKTSDEIFSHPVLGSSWEGFAIEQVISQIIDSWKPYFFRTSSGDEVDLLLVNNKKEIIAIEIKYSLSPSLSARFWKSYKELGCKKGYVIYPGKETYTIQNNVTVLPISKISKIN